MIRALDRNKWRSVIPPKIAMSFKLKLVWPWQYWPKVTKIAYQKIHWRDFLPTMFCGSISYRSWDSREGQNLPAPLSRARDSQTLSSACVKPARCASVIAWKKKKYRGLRPETKSVRLLLSDASAQLPMKSADRRFLLRLTWLGGVSDVNTGWTWGLA